MNKFRIYAWPAYSTKTINPYNYLIYKHIEELGYPVEDIYFGSINNLIKLFLSGDVKVVHLHWPKRAVLEKNSHLAVLWDFLRFIVFVKICRILNKKIFWTVHNLEEHEQTHVYLDKRLDAILYRNVDGFITLNKSGFTNIERKLVHPNRQKVYFIPHPHYQNYYENLTTKEEARRKLNIPSNDFVFLFFGQIRDYKNVPELINAFKGISCEKCHLVIAGKAGKNMDAQNLSVLIGGACNIILNCNFVAERDVQDYLNVADIVVTPYSKIFNSGSIFLNLSFNKPTLAPDIFSLSELKSVFGSRWVKTYSGILTSEILERAMHEVKEESKSHSTPDLKKHSPEKIARKTLTFYQSMLSHIPKVQN